MSQKSTFPKRPLNQPLDVNSPADPQDVLEVKNFLHRKGLYDIPEYGLTPYPDEKLFNGIRAYQKEKGLKIDGVMKANGETQESMRIEKEELPPPVVMIPGTDIPDKGMPDEGFSPLTYKLFAKRLEDFLSKMDPGMLKNPKDSKMDPDIFTKPYPRDPAGWPQQRPKNRPRDI